MSLILEALKKSEQQRRLGEAPTLGSPMIVMRRRRSVLPLIAVLVVIALGASWWLLRTPAEVPGVAQTPAPANAPAATAAAPPTGAARRDAPAQATSPTRPATAAPRKPVASLPADDQPGSVAPLPPASPLVGGPRNTPAATATKAPPPATTPVRSRRSTPATDAAPPAAAGAKPTVKTPPAAAPRRVARQPAAPALPVVWELPYTIRKDLPELNLTMHLYAPVPGERFVVIDGERYVEGDDIAEGVNLHEIRTDGMVLDFKGKRFVYPRDGR
jgi:general secretion pathway protein B